MSRSEKKDEKRENDALEEAQRQNAESEPTDFAVVDRRFWVKKDWDEQERSQTRLPSVLERLESQVKEKEQRIQEVREAAVAVRQESESYRQRLQRDIDRKLDSAKGQIFADLVEILDNLERSLEACKAAATDRDAALESLIRGTDMICALFHEKMARHGVKKLDVLHKPYNPETAEALDIEKTDNADRHDQVAKVFQEGYSLDGKTIRAARVSVAKYEGNK